MIKYIYAFWIVMIKNMCKKCVKYIWLWKYLPSFAMMYRRMIRILSWTLEWKELHFITKNIFTKMNLSQNEITQYVTTLLHRPPCQEGEVGQRAPSLAISLCGLAVKARFFSREQAKSECDWVMMSSVFVGSQSSCFLLCSREQIIGTNLSSGKQALQTTLT